jgi:hypothetical protein
MAVRSEPLARTATPAAESERSARPAGGRAVPDAILRMQRTAGNAAVARAIAPRAIQRCGANCGCSTCGHGLEDEDLLERGAGLLRSAVQRRSA